MFVDRVIIRVKAGDGGNGAVSFRREKAVPKGGPDGGNGGDGGDVVVVAQPGMSTLYDYRNQLNWVAQDGEPGGGKQCSGQRGKDLILNLPPGTIIINHETNAVIHDLKENERVVIARGGRGGFGNEHFKRSTNQTPKTSQPGAPGEAFQARLELKLIAEVGLVGLPNAGKSTMLAALTRANPKVADYPFTTLSPQLGVCELDAKRRIVIADIPGLIEGAAKGAGLGHDFLRHIERTRLLVHLLDATPDNGKKPAENYKVIREELAAYSRELADKPEIIALNKIELVPDAKERAKLLKDLARVSGARPDTDIFAVSGATKQGLPALLERVWKQLHPASKGELAGWKG